MKFQLQLMLLYQRSSFHFWWILNSFYLTAWASVLKNIFDKNISEYRTWEDAFRLEQPPRVFIEKMTLLPGTQDNCIDQKIMALLEPSVSLWAIDRLAAAET